MSPFTTKTKLMLCLTPAHVGEGGMQIGHVDNLLLRDMASQEPYVPGTTMLGNYSQFVYLWARCHCPTFVERKNGNVKNYGTEKNKREMTAYQLLFGLDRVQDNIPESQIHEKAVRFDSAKILWIPCMTLKGPKLVASRDRFTQVLGNIGLPVFPEDELLTAKQNLFNDKDLKRQANDLWWLNLKNLKITSNPSFWTDELANKIEQGLPSYLQGKKINENLVFVAESIFPYLISKCLEIRTSVSIDRVTRAGKDGALFTYELMPRGTLLYFDITVTPTVASQYVIPTVTQVLKENGSQGVWEILDKVRPYFEMVGLGGMTSRGFGKCKILDLAQEGA